MSGYYAGTTKGIENIYIAVIKAREICFSLSCGDYGSDAQEKMCERVPATLAAASFILVMITRTRHLLPLPHNSHPNTSRGCQGGVVATSKIRVGGMPTWAGE